MKTKLKSKLLSILLVLVMVLALVPFASLTAFAEDEENVLASAIVTIPIPEDGETSTEGSIFDSEKYNVSIDWSTTADGSVANDFTNQTFVAGNTYYVDVYLVAQDPYVFADGATVSVNGQAYTAVWTIGADYKKYVAVYDVPFTATEYIEKKFTLMPTGKTVGLNESYEITWQTNFEADEYKVLHYNVNTAQWETQATVAYKAGVNSFEVMSDKAASHLFKVQAIKGGNVVLEAPQFTVTWSADFQVSFLPNGGSGTIDPVFVTGKYTLPYCTFDAPEGYRFSHWTIAGQSYGQFEDITVTESIVVVANWLPTINCLPLEIDGSAMADMKTPESARLKDYLPKNEQMYYCGGKYCCGMSKASDTWYDAETDEPATEFVDGRTYYYHIGVHPANGYLLPVITEQEAKNIAMISGIEWSVISVSTMSSDNYSKQCYEADFYLIYDEERGIPAESRIEIDELHIDASNLAGATEPTKIDPSKLETEIFYPCGGEGCTECDDELGAINQAWLDINTDNIVNKFIDGHQYGFYLFLHLKPGYKCPDTVPENFLTLDGVQWEATMCGGFGNTIVFYGIITYSSETGIPAVPHKCEPIYVERVNPTCTEMGFEAHYACECGKNFEDAEGTVEIPDLVAWGAIDATGHDYGDLIAKVDATCSATGKEAHYECSVCHTLFDADMEVKTENELTIAIDANAHTYGAWTSNGDGTHTRVCSLNAEHKENGNCAGGTATCTEKAVCATCNTAYGNTAAHSHGSAWESDANEHWNECECGDKANKAAHADSDNNGKCDVCEYQMSTSDPGNDSGSKPGDNNTDSNNPVDVPDKDSKLGPGAIVAIVAGSVAAAGVGGFAIYWFVVKKKSFADLIAIFKRK